MRKEYGLLLPHFGQNASRERLVAGARKIEQWGFDSVWVRDHVVYHPHSFEPQNRNHVDPFVVLSAIAGVTERLKLGTAALIPHRHPIHTALLVGSLDFIAGPGRVIIGFGLGGFDHEFDALGLGQTDRRVLIEENVQIFRKLWTGDPVSHQGTYYQFTDVDIHPVPSAEQPVPVWYCGATLAAVRRAVEYCDGWLTGVIPIPEFKSRLQRMARIAAQHGKPVPLAGNIPYIVPSKSAEDALRYLNLPYLCRFANERYSPPPSGEYRTLDDLDGAVIWGPPERIVAEIRRWEEAGVSHHVLDLRMRFDDWEECVQMLAEEVLPELRRADRAPSKATTV